MISKVKQAITSEIEDYRMLLRNVPSVVMALFVVSVILMNLLANKEVQTNLDWLALDCGLFVSWLSFLAMDMLTKRFGPKASIKISLVAIGINLMVCGILFGVSKLSGNWGEFYNSELVEVNTALDNTFGGTWYVLLGSMTAFLTSSIVNAVINWFIGLFLKKSDFKAYAVRSYVSTMIAQFVDNLVFALIVSHVFFGWSLIQCLTCSATGCIVELLCEVVFSPIGYRVCKQWENHKVGQAYLDFKRR